MARSGALLTDANETSILKGFWRWVFLGLPLTPNGLWDYPAGSPEFQHSYIELVAFAELKRTGEFPENRTIITGSWSCLRSVIALTAHTTRLQLGASSPTALSELAS